MFFMGNSLEGDKGEGRDEGGGGAGKGHSHRCSWLDCNGTIYLGDNLVACQL